MSQHKRSLIFAWCLYDWANSAFATIITTFIFSTYFTTKLASSTITGTALWGYAITIAGIIIAILSPIVGAIADHTGRRQFWLWFFSWSSILATSLLWFASPNQSTLTLTLLLVITATVAYEMAFVFYNAMLPVIAPTRFIGRISGWAWGFGYVGGLLALVLALTLFVEGKPSWLDSQTAEHIRICAPLTALWFFIFSLPLLILYPSQQRQTIKLSKAVCLGLQGLFNTLKHAKNNRNIFTFLIARMLYTDGLNTLFAFGGIYAAGTFHMSIADVIRFGIAMNVAAGIGAIGFAWIDDWIGPKKTVIISLCSLMFFSLFILVTHSIRVFWIAGLSVSLFLGPIQAASRSLMVHLAPKAQMNAMFGLYALSGRITAYLSPWVLSMATMHFASQRVGMSTLMLFFISGLLILTRVKDINADA